MPRSSSPKSKSSSPPKSKSPTPAADTNPQDWIEPANDNDDADSATGGDNDSINSTASLTESILEYRTLHGRTYNSERSSEAMHWSPNDEQASEQWDINYFANHLLREEKLHLAPVDKLDRVLDVGTGTGIWAIDFADEHPESEVVATDLSPTQPSWVPTNLRFEIDDCTQDWTWNDNHFDFVRMNWMLGSIDNWNKVVAEAYRVLKPGGYFETQETNSDFDRQVGEGGALREWGSIFFALGEKTGRPFRVVQDDLQRRAMENAGFVDIVVRDFVQPVGTWPKDETLKKIGLATKTAIEADLEGVLQVAATEALGWSRERITLYAAECRNELRNSRDAQWVFKQRVVYGRKP